MNCRAVPYCLRVHETRCECTILMDARFTAEYFRSMQIVAAVYDLIRNFPLGRTAAVDRHTETTP